MADRPESERDEHGTQSGQAPARRPARQTGRSPAGALTRRSFLAAAAGSLVLVACGDDEPGVVTGSSAVSSGARPEPASSGPSLTPELNLVGFYAPDALVPGSPQRLPLGLADSQGALLTEVPGSLTITVTNSAGQTVGDPVAVAARGTGLPRSYYPLVFSPPGPGVYTLNTEAEGEALVTNVQLSVGSGVVQPGAAMVPVDTPTTADRRGVELLCTLTPTACPLHDVTLGGALGEGRPLAFLIATPQFCQTAVCGPVLDVLLAVRETFPQVRFLHSEVFPTVAAAQGGPASQLVPAVSAYGLTFEPCLFLARADGTVARRLDVIFDETEVAEALTELTA
ncbi:MAG: hypothetical protein ACT4PW_01450 [Acidimicrobiia bacterium]